MLPRYGDGDDDDDVCDDEHGRGRYNHKIHGDYALTGAVQPSLHTRVYHLAQECTE